MRKGEGMTHTFLSLDMNLIPQSTKDNVPTFWKGLFSNDLSRMLIDGKNGKGDLVHTQEALSFWLQWSENPQEIITQLLSTAIEYTGTEIKAAQNNIDSIWYISKEGHI